MALEIARPENPSRFLGEQLLGGSSSPIRRDESAPGASASVFEFFDSSVAPRVREAMALVYHSGLSGEDAVRELGALLLEIGDR